MGRIQKNQTSSKSGLFMWTSSDKYVKALLLYCCSEKQVRDHSFISKHEETNRHRFVSVNTTLRPGNMNSGILPDSSWIHAITSTNVMDYLLTDRPAGTDNVSRSNTNSNSCICQKRNTPYRPTFWMYWQQFPPLGAERYNYIYLLISLDHL